jgi:hypothetical protein
MFNSPKRFTSIPLFLTCALASGACIELLAGNRAMAQAPAAAEAAKSEQLPIRSITLYRSGVGSFQRRGMIEGTQTVQLRFDVNQINDILKSMVVLDLSGKGRVGGISYASRDPLAKRLSSFGVDISDEPSLGALLLRLRGAKVLVSVPDGNITGVVLGGETRQMTSGASPTPVAVPFINLLTETGIRSLNLALATNVDVLDKTLAEELHKALAAVAEHRADRIKTVDVNLVGDGSREVVVGYVQESPVWKASYRLVLPESPTELEGTDPAAAARMKDKLAMQGWAIIENTTDEDWNDIDLSLVSGQPVSFRMDLYQPLYATRPMVAVPTVPGAMPRIFEGGIASVSASMDMDGEATADRGPGGTGGEGGNAPRKSRMERASAGRPAAPAAADPGNSLELKSMAATYADLITNGAQSQARASESGEIFEYRLDHPITIERQRSAMLPIIADELSGRRVSIYLASEAGKHPMRGIELRNDSGLQLLPGPIAVYDNGTYAGDSQIGHVPAGDKRLLGYSVDLEVDARAESSQTSNVQKLRIVRGFLEMTSLTRHSSTYAFANKDAKRARTIILEHPKDTSWELKQPAKPYETTDSLLRFALDVPAGKSASLDVVRERIEAQRLEVVSTGVEGLLAYRKSGAKISEQTVEAVRRAAELAAAIREVEARVARLTKERGEIDGDQARIRQNMSSIDRASPLYATYLQKLTQQETRMDAIGTEQQKAAADLASAQQAVATYLQNLNVE